MSDLEENLLHQIKAEKLPLPQREVRFHETRRWRFDFFWPDYNLAVEVEGGTWTGGRHTRGSGFEKDCEKYNEATLLNIKTLRFTSTHIRKGFAIAWLKRAFDGRHLSLKL